MLIQHKRFIQMNSTKQTKKRHLNLGPTTQVLLAVGLFVISVLASRNHGMDGWELGVFHWIYGWPNLLMLPFFVVTQFGSIYMLGLLAIFYLASRHFHIVLRLLLSATLAYQLSGFAKDIWGRARPTDFLLDVINRDYIVRGPGFPSGHMALATALALTMGHYLPKRYHWIVWAWIVGVGISRIYLGVHAPLDVLGGFGIGWFSYALFRHVRLYDIKYRKKRPKIA